MQLLLNFSKMELENQVKSYCTHILYTHTQRERESEMEREGVSERVSAVDVASELS